MKADRADLEQQVRDQIELAERLREELAAFGFEGSRDVMLEGLAWAGLRLVALAKGEPNLASIAHLHLSGYPIGGE